MRRNDDAWVPVDLFGLGGRRYCPCAEDERGGFGSCDRRPGRARRRVPDIVGTPTYGEEELKAFLDSNSGDIASLVANGVRSDAAQSLTAPQKVEANNNTGSLSLVQSGDPDANLVTVFEAGLA